MTAAQAVGELAIQSAHDLGLIVAIWQQLQDHDLSVG
jgi:hypothetical protein